VAGLPEPPNDPAGIPWRVVAIVDGGSVDNERVISEELDAAGDVSEDLSREVDERQS
jgi:hypothetical protein